MDRCRGPESRGVEDIPLPLEAHVALQTVLLDGGAVGRKEGILPCSRKPRPESFCVTKLPSRECVQDVLWNPFGQDSTARKRGLSSCGCWGLATEQKTQWPTVRIRHFIVLGE